MLRYISLTKNNNIVQFSVNFPLLCNSQFQQFCCKKCIKKRCRQPVKMAAEERSTALPRPQSHVRISSSPGRSQTHAQKRQEAWVSGRAFTFTFACTQAGGKEIRKKQKPPHPHVPLKQGFMLKCCGVTLERPSFTPN